MGGDRSLEVQLLPQSVSGTAPAPVQMNTDIYQSRRLIISNYLAGINACIIKRLSILGCWCALKVNNKDLDMSWSRFSSLFILNKVLRMTICAKPQC